MGIGYGVFPLKRADLNATDVAWARAFAAQALADLDTRDLLADSSVPKCHRMQFVQMSAEKLCKAFRITANGLDELAYKHCIIAKTLPIVLREPLRLQGWSHSAIQSQLTSLKHLSREIELLSPSCHAEDSRPENAEYPWHDEAGGVITPANYSYPNLSDTSRSFLQLTKLMRTAAEYYLR